MSDMSDMADPANSSLAERLAAQRAQGMFDYHNSNRPKILAVAAIVLGLSGLLVATLAQGPRLYEQLFFHPPMKGMTTDDVALKMGESYETDEGTLTVSDLRRNGDRVCVDVTADLRDRGSLTSPAFILYLPSGAGFDWNLDKSEGASGGSTNVLHDVPTERCWTIPAYEQGTYWVELPRVSQQPTVNVHWGGEL